MRQSLCSLVLVAATLVSTLAFAADAENGGASQAVDSSGENEAGSGPKEKPAQGATQEPDPRVSQGLWGRSVRRGGFHLQLGFGVGGGPDTLGLFHTMELGYTFGRRGQHTVALLHTFIQNRGMLGTDLGGPDLIGGWMVEYKHPLFFPDLVAKVALGLGGTHDQGGEKLVAHPGFGASYGLDLHFPLTRRFGPTLTLAGLNVTAEGKHHFGVGLALGISLF